MAATFEYIEPESVRKNPFRFIEINEYSFRAEIYRLGVLIYMLIYEVLPFCEMTWKSLCNSILTEEVICCNKDKNGNIIPKKLLYIMRVCLNKNKDKRFSSACEILTILKNDVSL